MRRLNYLKKLLGVSIATIAAVAVLGACGEEVPSTEQTVQNEVTEVSDKSQEGSGATASGSESASDTEQEVVLPADKAEGEWEKIYTIYHSEYGNEGENHDSCTMSDDSYGTTAKMKISKKDGKLLADYIYKGFEEYYRYYGNELVFIEEAAYDGCDNKEWCLEFAEPFENESTGLRFTLVDEDTLIGVSVYTDGEKGTDDYYYTVTKDVYLKTDSPRLKDREELRYFETVKVSNAEELLENIKNNTKIILQAGTYDLSTVDLKSLSNSALSGNFKNPEDYITLKIEGVSNFCLEAEEGAEVLICVDEAYDPVMCFSVCNNVTLRGLTMGHNVEPGYCSGSVLKTESVTGLTIDGCKLYGCGTYGLEASNCEEINVTDTEIYECTYGLLDFRNVSCAHFKDCILRDSKFLSMIYVEYGYDIVFDNCQFRNNIIDGSMPNLYFVELSEYTDVTFKDCAFENNMYEKFSNRKVKQVNCRISDNNVDVQ